MGNPDIKRQFINPDLQPVISHRTVPLSINNRGYFHREVTEFPLGDPWSLLLRRAITKRGNEGLFNNTRELLELGVGTGSQFLTAATIAAESGYPVQKITGVDIDPQKLWLARRNTIGHKLGTEHINFIPQDAVAYVNELPDNSFNGVAIMCLPQAYAGDKGGTTSDIIGSNPLLNPYEERWGKFGLTLNAAVLDKLAEKSDPGTHGLVVLSGRISPDIRESLIVETGWSYGGLVDRALVRQDTDTPIDWMIGRCPDDGRRFRDSYKNPITISDAAARMENGEPVYHGVFIYEIINSKYH